jgi:hypothetical protein
VSRVNVHQWRNLILSAHGPETVVERLVLLAIAQHMKPDGTDGFPSQATIARRTSLCVRSVKTALASATRAGWVRRETKRRSKGRNWMFTTYLATAPDGLPVGSLRGETDAPAHAEGGENGSTRWCNAGHEVVQGLHTNSSLNSSLKEEAPKESLTRPEIERRIKSAARRSYERPAFEKEHPELMAYLRAEGGWNWLGQADERTQLGPRINHLLKRGHAT